MKVCERRYHATWVSANGWSPLAVLSMWLCENRAPLSEAPRDLLTGALANVAGRLPAVAAREPTRRHRKHFVWLLGWYARLLATGAGAGT